MSQLRLDQSLFLFSCEPLEKARMSVYRFRGTESLSAPFEFRIELVSRKGDIDLAAAIGQPASLTIYGYRREGWRYERRIFGVIERFEQLSNGQQPHHYEVSLVPALKALEHSRANRIFQMKNCIDITTDILSQWDIDDTRVKKFLHATYGAQEYCVQHQESDLHFIQRTWENAGIFYFFEHSKDHEVLILGDGSQAFEALEHCEEVSFRSHPQLYEESVFEFLPGRALRPGTAALRDYEWKHPSLDMESSAQTEEFARHEMYYFPGGYGHPNQGRQIARLRQEEVTWQGLRYVGRSDVRAMMPGQKFKLKNHPRTECNQEYVLLSVEHEGTQPQALGETITDKAGPNYRNRIQCLPVDVAYRPPRQTPRPQIAGLQTAVVVGPPGEEIHCDEHGRVKVQFHWDRQGQNDDRSSCWIRVGQPWGGMGYGGMFIPRIGNEVLVQFLDGDPDRPLIIGRVYNGENLPPIDLPQHKTQSVLRTASTPASHGYNELRFEDATGREEISLRAERDLTERVLRNHVTHVTGLQVNNVGLSRTISVGGSEQHVVGQDQSVAVGHDQSLAVGQHQTIHIAGNYRLEVTGDTGAAIRVTSDAVLNAQKSLSLRCGQSQIVLLPDKILIESPLVRINGGLVKINCSEE